MRKKDRIELGIIGAGLVVLIFVLFGVFNRSGHNKALKPAHMNSVAGISMPQGAILGKSIYSALESGGDALELKVDPFTGNPIANLKKVSSGIVLSGVLWDKNIPLALINGKVMKKGDHVGDLILSAINENEVILNDGSRDIILKIGQ
jgi:hypothetical protein